MEAGRLLGAVHRAARGHAGAQVTRTQAQCLGTKVPSGSTLHHRLLTDDVVDAEHARLSLTDPGRGLVVVQHGRMRRRGGQLGTVARADPCIQGVWVRGPAHRGRREGAGALHVTRVGAHIRALEALPPPQEAAVVKHILRGRVQGPVVALPRPARLPRDLNEAVV